MITPPGVFRVLSTLTLKQSYFCFVTFDISVCTLRGGRNARQPIIDFA